MTALLCAVFFLSGAAGLLFESLWFRLMGLTLGNGVWASSIVLASFMAGLAAGNAIAARKGHRLRRPLRLYAIVECIVGFASVAIVVLLPPASPVLARIFAQVAEHGSVVNLLRLSVAFFLMLVPTTAMGLTLPLLAKAISGRDVNFGRVLGRLYGWNTFGGVAGALGGELWLIGWLGLRGTALAAGALNLAAALVALSMARRTGEGAAEDDDATSARQLGSWSFRSWRLLVAAFLAGATLLALEAIWFRFLQLFVYGTGLIFAAMLAVVLLGIGAGGVLASVWLSRDPRAHRFAPLVALAAALAVDLSYALFEPRIGGLPYTTGNTAGAFSLFLRLMLPASLLSGLLFTLLGAAQRHECGGAAETAGKLTFANTLGAMVGALLAGFVLLPRLGMEKALFVCTLSYGLIACLAMVVPVSEALRRRPRAVLGVAIAAFGLVAIFYPFGRMKRHFLPLVIDRYKSEETTLMAVREGLTETVMYLRTSYYDQPLHHRLMTNGHSMSATTFRGRRYMKLYAYWALAVNPSARKALLISYGVGTTAKALTDARQLESIDVVDISREILELGRIAFPGERPPLDDPRVRVHVEDGRFFLQTSAQKFDLITAEPPPLRGAGVTSLYSREYFQLVHDRLREGGVATYWLPVNQLWLSETKAIMRGFCDAFSDCTLWSGAGLQWMLAGTRGAHGPVAEEQFSAQWRDATVAPELAALGFETPEALGTTFLADAGTLGAWSRGAEPLDDDHPGRILHVYPQDENGDPIYRSWMEPRLIRQRFESSAFIRDLWPPELRRRTVDQFAPQGILDDLSVWRQFNPLQALHGVLTLSSLRTLPLLLMGIDPAAQKIAVRVYAAGARTPDLELEMGARAFSERDYQAAADHFALVTERFALDKGTTLAVKTQLYRALALALLGKPAEARELLNGLDASALSSTDAHSAEWLSRFLQGKRVAQP